MINNLQPPPDLAYCPDCRDFPCVCNECGNCQRKIHQSEKYCSDRCEIEKLDEQVCELKWECNQYRTDLISVVHLMRYLASLKLRQWRKKRIRPCDPATLVYSEKIRKSLELPKDKRKWEAA